MGRFFRSSNDGLSISYKVTFGGAWILLYFLKLYVVYVCRPPSDAPWLAAGPARLCVVMHHDPRSGTVGFASNIAGRCSYTGPNLLDMKSRDHLLLSRQCDSPMHTVA